MTARQRNQPEQLAGPLPNLPTKETYQIYGYGVSLEAAREAFERKYGYPPAWVGRVKPGDIAAGPVRLANPAANGDGAPNETAAAPTGEGEERLL